MQRVLSAVFIFIIHTFQAQSRFQCMVHLMCFSSLAMVARAGRSLASAPTQERNGATTMPTAQSSFRARTQCKSLRMDDLDTILIILPQHIISTSFSGLFFYCRNVPARTLLRSHAHASPSQLSGTSADSRLVAHGGGCFRGMFSFTPRMPNAYCINCIA